MAEAAASIESDTGCWVGPVLFDRRLLLGVILDAGCWAATCYRFGFRMPWIHSRRHNSTGTTSIQYPASSITLSKELCSDILDGFRMPWIHNRHRNSTGTTSIQYPASSITLNRNRRFSHTGHPGRHLTHYSLRFCFSHLSPLSLGRDELPSECLPRFHPHGVQQQRGLRSPR